MSANWVLYTAAILVVGSLITAGQTEAMGPSLSRISGSQIASSGSCSVSSEVKSIAQEVMDYKNRCGTSATKSKNFAVNDMGASPRMYIFSPEGTCISSYPVAWGKGKSGESRAAPPRPCAESNERMTPPGLHLTTPHDGARYGPTNSIGLKGLDGQPSKERGVVIHGRHNVAAGATWGCLGLSNQDLKDVMSKVGPYSGYGSYIYNHFSRSPASTCDDNSGSKTPSQMSCPGSSGGGGRRSNPSGNGPAID